jgi:hypothetical protein
MMRPEHRELMGQGEIPKKSKPIFREDHVRS